MKLALRWIPTEVWVDVFSFPWISRQQLGRIVHRFGNRKFAEILQYCLHERGKRILSTICLDQFTYSNAPQTEMPENIRFFENIVIRHFDSSTLAFLRLISALFTGVNLNFDAFGPNNDFAKLRTVLDHITPLLYGIHSMSFDQCAIPLVERYFGPKLAQAKMLAIDFGSKQHVHPAIHTAINFAMNWLTAGKRDCFESKFLEVCIRSENFQQFSTAIQQQFLSAKWPSKFAIKLSCSRYQSNDQIFYYVLDLENGIGEKLNGQFQDGYFWIYRHSVNFARKRLVEWVEETVEKRQKSSCIRFFEGLTIGQIDANVGEDEVNAIEGEAEDQPSTSKKPRLG